MPPTLFGKELKYYSPHKDTKQRLTTQWAAADSQPNIWRCSKIQAASVLQHLKLFCYTAQPGSVLQLSLQDQFCCSVLHDILLLLKQGTEPGSYFEESEVSSKFLGPCYSLYCFLCWIPQSCSIAHFYGFLLKLVSARLEWFLLQYALCLFWWRISLLHCCWFACKAAKLHLWRIC